MNSINNKISCIRVNDIFHELIDENQMLIQCLKVFIEFKTFVDFISTKIENNLETNEFQKLKDLTQNVEEVVKNFMKDFDMNSNFNNVMKTPEKRSLLRLNNNKIESKAGEKPEEVIPTEETQQSVTDINTSQRKRTPTKKSMLNKRIYNKKIRKTINNKKSKPKQSDETNNYKIHHKLFVCDFNGCEYKTHRKELLGTHSNSHTRLKPYKCNFCRPIVFLQDIAVKLTVSTKTD